MDVGVARPHHDPVVVVEQEEAVEIIGPGHHDEEQPQENGTVDYGCGRYPLPSLGEFDVTVRPIYRSGDGNAQVKDQQHPVFEREQGGKREKVEAEILAVEGIALSVRRLVEETENQAPFGSLDFGDRDSDDDGDPGDEPTPWELRKPECRRLRQPSGPRPNGCGAPVEGYRKPWPSLPGVPERQRSGHPHGDGRSDENSTEEAGLGGENRPEDLAIADR